MLLRPTDRPTEVQYLGTTHQRRYDRLTPPPATIFINDHRPIPIISLGVSTTFTFLAPRRHHPSARICWEFCATYRASVFGKKMHPLLNTSNKEPRVRSQTDRKKILGFFKRNNAFSVSVTPRKVRSAYFWRERLLFGGSKHSRHKRRQEASRQIWCAPFSPLL